MDISWILMSSIYVFISLYLILFLYGKSSGSNEVLKVNNELNTELKKAKNEVDSLHRQLEQEKMARRVDNVAVKMKSQFDSLLTEVTEEAEVALNTMAEDVMKVKQNVPVVEQPVMKGEASPHMQVERKKVSPNFASIVK